MDHEGLGTLDGTQIVPKDMHLNEASVDDCVVLMQTVEEHQKEACKCRREEDPT